MLIATTQAADNLRVTLRDAKTGIKDRYEPGM